ncbi:MAG: histidine phosphatase family protein [Gammaproteobacteria bacterium]|nr:histidine phosphatase family protein [Gammaproteobacteria bacterium]
MSMTCFLILVAEDLYANEVTVWNALKSGNHFALMRHAIAPGTGDPSYFELGKCSTQRNLSLEGRNQALEIGKRFRANGIDKMHVFSSQWCRCLETAKLLSLGAVQELPALNSFFQKYEREELQTQMLKEWLVKQDLTEPLLLVTHQVNITALTKVYPASGEIVIVRQSKPGEFIAVDRIQID